MLNSIKQSQSKICGATITTFLILYINSRLYSKDALNLELEVPIYLFPPYDFLYYCTLPMYTLNSDVNFKKCKRALTTGSVSRFSHNGFFLT